MIFICYPKCGTCKKAAAYLTAKNAEYTVRNIKDDNPTAEEIKKWQEKSGLPLKRFFNTSGLKYRELNLKDRLKTMSEDEQLNLLATDGMLVKRPILAAGERVLVGFKEKEWDELFN
jgi:arsenate reductase